MQASGRLADQVALLLAASAFIVLVRREFSGSSGGHVNNLVDSGGFEVVVHGSDEADEGESGDEETHFECIRRFGSSGSSRSSGV